MVCKRSRAAALALPETVSIANDTGRDGRAPSGDEYERLRDERIRENLDRLKKLGIVDLALKLRSDRARATPPTKRPCCRTDGDKISLAFVPRRSPRLRNVPSVSYSEGRVKRPSDKNATVVAEEGVEDEVYAEEHGKLLGRYEEEWNRKRPSDKNATVVAEEGVEDEVYTEEHDKLLGRYDEEWHLCVDGYGNDGRKIYGDVNGKSCHQCRCDTDALPCKACRLNNHLGY